MADTNENICADLIDQTVEQVKAFAVQGSPNLTRESVTACFHGYEDACSELLAIALTEGFGAEEKHYSVWQRALQCLGSRTSSNDLVLWFEDLQRYPATLLLYALGLGAVKANQFQFLKHMLSTKISFEQQNDMPALQILSPPYLFSEDESAIRVLEEIYGGYATLNHRIQEVLRPHARSIIPDENRYSFVFDKFEILMALSYAYYNKSIYRIYRNLAPPSIFVYRDNNTVQIFQEIEESLSTMQAESPYVTCGIFGETSEECEQGLQALKQFISDANRWWM